MRFVSSDRNANLVVYDEITDSFMLLPVVTGEINAVANAIGWTGGVESIEREVTVDKTDIIAVILPL